MAIVDISGLSFTYSGTDQPAIRDIDIRVESGEFILLVGPSGCGKSTLCRCLNGLIPHFHTGEMKGRVLAFCSLKKIHKDILRINEDSSLITERVLTFIEEFSH